MRTLPRTRLFARRLPAQFSSAVIGSLLIAQGGSAQTNLTLKDAISLALTRRPELRASADKLESSSGLRRQAALRPNPRLIFQTEDIRTSNFNFGQDSQTYAYASQVFEARGKRGGRIAVAEQVVERGKSQVDNIRREIAFNVREAYWQAEAAQRARELYAQDDDYFRQIVDYHQTRFNEGKLAEVNLLRVRLERERLHAAAENAKLEAERAMLRLARELSLPTEENWNLVEDFQILAAPTESSNDSDLLTLRPEGRLALAALAEARANIELQKANRRQDVQGLLGYKRNGPDNTMIAGLQINLPVFDRNQGGIAASEADARAAEENVVALRNQITSEVALARREFQMRRDQYLQTFQPLFNRAVEISDISRAAYREGGLDLVRLLDAERLRVEAQISWVNSLLTYHQSVAALEYAEGVER
jgi:cobalt-zinc-cadmium efflux system outer membrane protein